MGVVQERDNFAGERDASLADLEKTRKEHDLTREEVQIVRKDLLAAKDKHERDLKSLLEKATKLEEDVMVKDAKLLEHSNSRLTINWEGIQEDLNSVWSSVTG